MNKEIIETIKKVKTATELKEVAAKNGYNLTDIEAKGYFDLYHNHGVINDNELDNVTGGSTCVNGRRYSDDSHHYLIVTWGNSCPGFKKKSGGGPGMGTNCFNCEYNVTFEHEGATNYCNKRTIHDDPYNDKINTTREKLPNGRYW